MREKKIGKLSFALFLLASMIVSAQRVGPSRRNSSPMPLFVEVKGLWMSVSPEVAAKWGLDGCPAPDPEKTPLGKDIPMVMTPDETQKVVTALRRKPGTRVLGSSTVAVQSDQTAIQRTVEEQYFAESHGSPKELPDVSYPEFGETRDIGVILEVTPKIDLQSGIVDLLLRPQLYRLVGYTHQDGKFLMPVISALTIETSLMLPSGSTCILSSCNARTSYATPSGKIVTPPSPKEEERVLLFLITATAIQKPVISEQKFSRKEGKSDED